MFCSKCGTKNSDNSKFCAACGARIESNHVREQQPVPDIIPEAVVPETAIPETAAPEGATLEAATSGTAIPEIPLPEIAIPEDTLPEVKLPETIIPEAFTPNMKTADISNGYNSGSGEKVNGKQPARKKKIWIIPTAVVLVVALVGAGYFWGVNKTPKEEADALKQQEAVTAAPSVEAAVTNEIVQELKFTQDKLKVNAGEESDMYALLSSSNIEKGDLIWSSSNTEAISVDKNGKLTVNQMGVTVTIKVTCNSNNKISAICEVTSASEKDSLTAQLLALNAPGAKLESIDITKDNYSPAERNKSYKWDTALFYTLEEISPDNAEDGLINSYDIEKKQLVNDGTGNKMEYEIYRNPANNIVNKIVSIEYLGDYLKISDYYFDDNGKVNFIFVRKDINYIPAYANPTIDGERFYFNKDVLVKWRTVKEGKQTNYIIGGNEKERGGNAGKVYLYDDLAEKKQKAYDKKEKEMINAAYNTYQVVLAAKGISNIIGYVNDEYGNPMAGAKVKLYSVEYGDYLLELETDGNGMYSIVVPSKDAEYNILVELNGYVATTLYGIRMDKQSVGVYQENIYLVHANGSSYDIELVLTDALNRADDYDGMLRLDNAGVQVRPGINNKTGSVYLSAEADQNGQVYVNLKEGTYTVEINKTGYATTYYTIVAKEGINNIQINTSPLLNEDEIRIVLTWSDNPKDLDSHLFTPYDSTSGDSTYHIWFGNKADFNGNNLDVDDTDGYGPETMTINHLGNGLYKYYVADYSDCSIKNTSSTAMSFSDARVSVYTKDGLVQSYYVPNNKEGVIWELFEIRNKRIIPIQRYYNNIDDKTWWNNEK
ncbi:zinc-ribbon domain-containing protein [Anaerocolumna xylanovorans]|uniref:Ig-like domain (Group 2) n=1 Tax=Anaerocolumna xylanovorans DSM 12503 TaxID=1121345 RepID=A0A1M7Y486_9FIRM|nr:zinc-ribbon domain-containing protein [Anaerocolumna xylanovorans]SHO47103.1 Ig-like domain (group 2) [Anaerocolumna xylanovorans DSM 12503]